MTYDEVPEPMRVALATFEMLRRLGFTPEEILWHHNGNEPPGGPEPRGMMFVVLKVDDKEFLVRTGVVPTSYEQWQKQWLRVQKAAKDHTLSDDDYDRMLLESEAYQFTDDFCQAIRAKGIRIPAFEALS